MNDNFYTIDVFSVAMPVIFGILMLIVIFMPLSAKNDWSTDSNDNDMILKSDGRQPAIQLS